MPFFCVCGNRHFPLSPHKNSQRLKILNLGKNKKDSSRHEDVQRNKNLGKVIFLPCRPFLESNMYSTEGFCQCSADFQLHNQVIHLFPGLNQERSMIMISVVIFICIFHLFFKRHRINYSKISRYLKCNKGKKDYFFKNLLSCQE